MKIIVKLTINVFALYVVAYLVPGFVIDSLQAGIVAAVVIGVVNTFIKPILQLIALPISVFTLGVAAFLLNVALLYLVSMFVPGFTISSFVTAMIASVILSLVTWFLHKLASE